MAATAAGLAGGLAGCLGQPGADDSDEQSEHSGSAAFFALQDWGNQVGGEILEFESPIEVGEMGHGWDPDADIVPEIAQHDVFLYLATPEFQWAIDVAADLAAESDDTRRIDGMTAVPDQELLPFAGDADELVPAPDRNVDWDPETVAIGEFDVIVANDVAAWWHDDHWHGGLPDVPVDGTRQAHFSVTDTEGNVLPLGEDDPFAVEARISDGAPADVLSLDSTGETLEIQGETEGLTTLEFVVIAADGTEIFATAGDPLTVTVAEPDEIEVDAFHDPHVWVDPVHAQSIVELIATELGEVFPDHAETFAENAEAFTKELRSVDEQFQDLAEAADLTDAVLVAHDAFQYLEDRYGFTLHTPVGVTPDAAESIEDIAELAGVIEEHDIDTILFDPFEAPDPDTDIPQGAQVLLDETGAEEALPLSATEGTTSEWQSAGYGWVEQMEKINLPALRQALRAE